MTQPADPIMTFFGRYVSHEMSNPDSGLYLPKLIREMALDPYFFGGMHVDKVTETDDIICMRSGDFEVQPSCYGLPDINLAGMTVKGLSNITVYHDPLYHDVNHYELSFTFTKGNEGSSLTFSGDFRLDQRCRYPDAAPGHQDFTATGTGTFTATVGTAYVNVYGTMETDGNTVEARVDQIQFDARAFIGNVKNITISVNITDHEAWNFYAEQALNAVQTIDQMTSQLSETLNQEQIRQMFAKKITEKINEVIS
ncbi:MULTISPECIES: hypothetical protein [Paenibacillus]|nr:hypothetical protein [Paenibacillus rhizosphaerae]